MVKNAMFILSLLVAVLASSLTAQAQATGPGTVVVERVFVTGNVKYPQEVLFSEGLTLSRALAWAGGVLADSDTKRVMISRDDGTKFGPILFVNLKAIRDGKAKDFILRPYDVVCVPLKRPKGANCNIYTMRRPTPELPSRVLY